MSNIDGFISTLGFYMVQIDCKESYESAENNKKNLHLEKVKEAALVVPEVQYIGWDVAILKNSVALIEGNHDLGLILINCA